MLSTDVMFRAAEGSGLGRYDLVRATLESYPDRHMRRTHMRLLQEEGNRGLSEGEVEKLFDEFDLG